MKIRCEAVDVLDGSRVTTLETINNLDDYIKLRAAVVSTSKAFFNGVQIVKDGYILDYAYNKEREITDFLLGNITEEVLNAVIDPD